MVPGFYLQNYPSIYKTRENRKSDAFFEKKVKILKKFSRREIEIIFLIE